MIVTAEDTGMEGTLQTCNWEDEQKPSAPQYTVRQVSDTDINFAIFHKQIFEAIQEWDVQPNTQETELLIQWEKRVFSGL